MAAKPWERVPPIEEKIVPNRITTRTSHRMPNAARVGQTDDETGRVMTSN
jgi:hypothetical protein